MGRRSNPAFAGYDTTHEETPGDGKNAPPLSICLVANGSMAGTGGLATYQRLLARHLTTRGEQVRAIARYETIPPPGGISYAAAEPPRILKHEGGGGALETRIIAPNPAFHPLLRYLLPRLASRPPLHGLAASIMIGAYRDRLRAAMPEKVDVIHYIGTGWELLGFAAEAVAHQSGAGFTVLPAVHPGAWGDSALDIALYNKADAVLTLSEAEQEHLREMGVEKKRLRVVDLAPATEATGDGARFRNRQGLGERPLILFIGRKERAKGYHALREAMARVIASVPEACLIAIGPDAEPPYPVLPEGALLDLGKADDAEKEDALAACDIFCMPSSGESFGLVYVEAWAYGKPVVAGPAPAVRELVANGVNGFRVAQEKEEIADALLGLLGDSALRHQLGSAGQALQKQRYSWDRVTERHQRIFRAVR